MEDCAQSFRRITGFELVKRKTDYRSAEEIDETLFETVSRLFYEDRKGFYRLKGIFTAASRATRSAVVFSVAGYFHYVECEFERAKRCFKAAIRLDPADLESWFCLAFCHRQSGEEDKFNSIIREYTRLIPRSTRRRT